MGTIPVTVKESVEKLMIGYKKRVETYLNKFSDKAHKRYMDFFKKFTVADPEEMKLIIQYPTEDDKSFYDVPYEMKAQTSANVQFAGLHFENVTVSFEFPTVLIGAKSAVPQIIFKIKSPVAYPGNIGLVWEGISEEKGKYAFHPFQSKLTMKKDLLGYYKDGVVDQFCDILNKGEQKILNNLHKFLEEMTAGDYTKYFKYQGDVLHPYNYITVPLIGEFNEQLNMTTFTFRTWAMGTDWLSPVEPILDVLEPICSIVSLFDEKGELKSDTSTAGQKAEMDAKMAKSDRRVLLTKKDRLKDKLDYDPFSPQAQSVKRDEFGYGLDKKSGFNSMDLTAARKGLQEAQKKAQYDEVSAPKQDISHVKQYASPEAWFEACSGKRFTVKGDSKGLSFMDRANYDAVKGCSPPFILKYARDQIRIKRSVTSAKAVELLFSVYNMGFLYEC